MILRHYAADLIKTMLSFDGKCAAGKKFFPDKKSAEKYFGIIYKFFQARFLICGKCCLKRKNNG